MQRSHPYRYKWLAALALVCCVGGNAATVYRTVDENGVVSFSDTPPAGDAPVETVEITPPPAQPGAEQQQRLQDMRETTDRMAADRMAREKHRAEMRRLKAETQPVYPAQEEPRYYGSSWGYSGNYPVRRPWRPGHRPRPEHPIVHPPLRPPAHGRPPTVRPLPGNDYPASLIRRSYDPKVRAALRK